MQTIENSLLQVSVDENGAQMTHIVAKTSKDDYLQNKDKQENVAIAFPAIAPEENLALDLPWTVVDKGDVRVSMTMIDTPESYKKFPYHFELMVTYALEGNQVQVEFYIKNNSNKEMPYAVGMLMPLVNGWQAKTDVNKMLLQGPDQRSGTIESTDLKLTATDTRISCVNEAGKLAPEGSTKLKLNLIIG